MSLSLMSIMNSDPEFGRRISKKVEEIKHDKKNLMDAADSYGDRYKQEILEGTEKRNRLLTEGVRRGLSEDEVMRQHNGFIPTVYTPLLNLLYFLIRESDNDPYYGSSHYDTRNKLNEQFGQLREEDIEKTVLKNTPDIEEFLYGSVTLDQFDVLKKLKALSMSDNLEEATLAFRKGKELSLKYNLDWERIPCSYKNTKNLKF